MSSRDELVTAVKAAASDRDGRAVLSCSDAFRLAEAHAAPVAMIGRICNETGIKIVHCQLGCFK